MGLGFILEIFLCSSRKSQMGGPFVYGEPYDMSELCKDPQVEVIFAKASWITYFDWFHGLMER